METEKTNEKTDWRLFITWQVIVGKRPVFHTTGVPQLVGIDHRLKQDTHMFNYQIHSIETAPEKSKPLLELFTHAIGFVPNLAGAIANSPVLANSLLGLFKNVHGGNFTETEVQILLLTNAVTNSSAWPVAFHTALGLKQGIDPTDIQAIREGQLPKPKRYAALSGLAKKLIEKRGQLTDEDVTAFLEAGFEKEHLLEVVAVVAASTITNYAGKITNPPLEAVLREHAWRG